MTTNHGHKTYVRTTYVPNGSKTFQMAIKYINTFYIKALEKYIPVGIFGVKISHLAALTFTLFLKKQKKF
jgi:hypothetical protein